MYRVFEHSQIVLSGFQCMCVLCNFTSCTVTIRIDYCFDSSSTSIEIRNYLVANPIVSILANLLQS